MEELKQKYKNLPLWARLGFLALLGLLPAVYGYLDQGQEYEDRLLEAQNQEQIVRMEFEKARQRKASLPKLEEELAFTEDQLSRAKKLLPDQVRIEEILEKVALIAKDTDVTLMQFKPEQPVVHEDAGGYRYVEIPIDTEIVGSYQKIASFFDNIAHLETAIFVREITIVPDSRQNQLRDQNQNRQQGDLGAFPTAAQGPNTIGLPTPDQIEATLNPGILIGPDGTAQVPRPAQNNGTNNPRGGRGNKNLGGQIDLRNGDFVESAKFKLILYRGGTPMESLPDNPGAKAPTG